MANNELIEELNNTGRLTEVHVARWRDAAELLAAFDAIASDGAHALVKVDGGRTNGVVYTVVVSGGKLGDTFFREDGADLCALLSEAITFYRELVWPPMRLEPWQELILVRLQELTDAEFQTRVWLRAEIPNVVSSPVEAVCGLFDDSGLGDLLEKGPAFSEPADSTLRHLGELIDSLDFGVPCERLLANPRWATLRALAATALAQVREALEPRT